MRPPQANVAGENAITGGKSAEVGPEPPEKPGQQDEEGEGADKLFGLDFRNAPVHANIP
jgi:hypothetical protein